MQITRTLLDQTLPSGPALASRANSLTSWPQSDLEHYLNWLAFQVEEDRFSSFSDNRPDWAKDNAFRFKKQWWPITWDGLDYKREGNYLTAEEWYADTTCWYGRFSTGIYYFIGAETPLVAAQRCVVFMDILKRQRAMHPDQTDHIETMLHSALKEAA